MRYEVLPFERAAEQAARLDEPQRLTGHSFAEARRRPYPRFAVELLSLGHAVTPHIAARGVRGRDHLSELLERAAEAQMTDVFVIGGARPAVGPYGSAGDHLEVMADHPLRPACIGVAALSRGSSADRSGRARR